MTRALWGLFLSCALGCGGIIEGNRRLIARDREVPSFTGLEVEQGIIATVAFGELSQVHVEGEANLVDTLQLDVQDGVLRASWRFLITKHHPISLAVSVPELTRVRASGGSQVQAESVRRAGHFEVSAVEGSGVVVSGQGVDELALHLSGGSLGDLDGLSAMSADVDVSDGSQAELRVSEEVRGNVSQGSAVRLYGQPRLVRIEASGDSKVETVAP